MKEMTKSYAINRIAELEQENTELKVENERLIRELKNNKAAYQVELSTYNMECGNLLEENKQLLQTLQEIKKIAERLDDFTALQVLHKIQILDLITKAEVWE